jgi:hypothetical protein
VEETVKENEKIMNIASKLNQFSLLVWRSVPLLHTTLYLDLWENRRKLRYVVEALARTE